MAINNKMTIKPTRLYCQTNLRHGEINIGDILPVRINGYSIAKGMVYCSISHHVNDCFIRMENYIFQKLLHATQNEILLNEIDNIVVAKVVAKNNDGSVELDQKMLIEDTKRYLSENIGNVITATVEHIKPYGAFLDMGNGVRTLLHISEFSESKCVIINKLCSVGETITVKLMDFNPKTNRFSVSRRQLCEKENLERGDIKLVRILQPVDEHGVFVEYNPATVGIMNIEHKNLNGLYGRYAMCYIKKNTKLGFRGRCVIMVNKPIPEEF